MRRPDEVVGGGLVVAVGHQRAHEGGADAAVGGPVGGEERPQPVGPGVVGRAVEEQEGGAVGQPGGEQPRAHDPAEVGEPEHAVAGADVGLEGPLLGHLHGPPAVDVHHALGAAGGAGRVGEEERCARCRPARWRTARRPAPGQARTRPSSGTVDGPPAVHDHHGGDVDSAAASRAVASIGTGWPRRGKASAVIRATAPASSRRTAHGLGAVAGEHRHEHGAELGHGQHGGDGLGEHRQEDADGVARPARRAGGAAWASPSASARSSA